jgi:flagellar assembly protein FliH
MKELQDLLKDKIESYEFQPLFENSEREDGISGFEFKPLQKDQVMDVQEHEKVIKIERKRAVESNFEIAPIVKEHRGINRQEELERQRLIQEEVEKQLVRIQDQAYREGFEKGLKDGQEEVFNQTRAEVEQKLEALTEMIQEVLNTHHDLLQKEKMSVYRTIRNLTKWVILRELEDDGEYIFRLLDKLINELQVKSNILIQIDSKSFEDKPDILEILEQKIGELSNVRLEVDYDIEGPGIVVESENGIINGSLKEQMYNLSRLFEAVGLKAEIDEPSEYIEDGKIKTSEKTENEVFVQPEEVEESSVEGDVSSEGEDSQNQDDEGDDSDEQS